MQDLTNKEEQDIFNKYVEDRDMELVIKFNNEDILPLVEEHWNSKDKSINLKRVYYYNDEVINKLDIKIQKAIYESKLEILVDSEDYEESARIRDKIKMLDI
jgi:protein-arginine kinase activator protein McsA